MPARTKKQERFVPQFGFGDRLRLARRHAGLGTKELSAKLGLYETAITVYERSGRVPSPKNRDPWELIQDIARATGVDPIWLMTGKDDTGA